MRSDFAGEGWCSVLGWFSGFPYREKTLLFYCMLGHSFNWLVQHTISAFLGPRTVPSDPLQLTFLALSSFSLQTHVLMKTPKNWQSLQLPESSPLGSTYNCSQWFPGALYSLATLWALPELPISACAMQNSGVTKALAPERS